MTFIVFYDEILIRKFLTSNFLASTAVGLCYSIKMTNVTFVITKQNSLLLIV